jgi:ABC-type transport system substrate-binding protein
MQKLGYGPDKRLPIKVSTRDIVYYRDPAVILIDQLKEVYIDGELDTIDTTNWYPKIMRKDYTIGLNITEAGVDDPDTLFYENYVCGAQRNYSGYCDPDLDKLVDRQSIESDQGKRKQLVWEIERKLAKDDARPVIFYGRIGTCWQPQFKGNTVQVNSIYARVSKTSGWINDLDRGPVGGRRTKGIDPGEAISARHLGTPTRPHIPIGPRHDEDDPSEPGHGSQDHHVALLALLPRLVLLGRDELLVDG